MNRYLRTLSIGTLSLIATIGAVQLLPSPSFAIPTRGATHPATTAQSPDALIAAPSLPTPADVRRIEARKRWERLFLPREIPTAPVLDVVPNPEAEGADRERQLVAARRISQQAERAHFVPAARLRHFAWIKATSAPPIIGWRGTIQELVDTPAGVSVRMQVSPVFPGTFMTTVYTVETYTITGSVVRPVAIAYSDPSLPRVITDP